MKFLHISDLHLGKKLNDISLLEDQIDALKQIAVVAEKEGVESVLIAGDIYQQTSPSSEAMTAFNDFICQLTQLKIKVFVISGNHDSDARISYFSSLVRDNGIYLSEKFNGRLQQISLFDEYGEIVISMLPFIRPVNVKAFYPDKKADTYDSAVKCVINNAKIDTEKRNIILCHQFITGAQTSESEEKYLGGLENVDADIFDDFDYVALGHIHKPQAISRRTVRYSGSLLKYSLGEANQKKTITLLDIKEKGKIDIKEINLNPKNDVREIEDCYDNIMKMPYSEDYVGITLTDEFVSPDAKVSIATVFPNMIKFGIKNSKTKTDMDILAVENIKNKSICDMFFDFYKLQSNSVEPAEKVIEEFLNVLKEVENDKYEAD